MQPYILMPLTVFHSKGQVFTVGREARVGIDARTRTQRLDFSRIVEPEKGTPRFRVATETDECSRLRKVKLSTKI